ncbi:MAG: O-antigen ligase family protein [Dehalococcoidia bacterium]
MPRWSRWFLLATVVVLPILAIPYMRFGFDIPKLTLAAVSGGALLVASIPRMATLCQRSGVAIRLVIGSAIGLGLWSITSALRNDVPALAALGQDSRFVGAIAIASSVSLVVIVPSMLIHERHVEHALDALTIAVGFVALYAIAQALGLDPSPWGPEFGGRPVASLGNSNFVGGFMALGVPLTLRLWTKYPLDRRVAAIVGILVLIVLILSEALLGWIAAGSAVIATAIATSRRLPRNVAAGLVSAIPTGVAVSGIGVVWVGAQAGYLTGEARLAYWDNVSRVFQQAPVSGVGVGRMLPNYRGAREPGSVIEAGRDAVADSSHAWLLDVTATLGLTGAILLIGCLIATGFVLRSLWLEGDRAVTGVTVTLIALLAAHGMQSSIAVPSLALVWTGWLLIGLVLAQANVHRAAGQSLTPIDSEGPDTGSQSADGDVNRAPTRLFGMLAILTALVVALPMGTIALSARDFSRSTLLRDDGRTTEAQSITEDAINRTPWWTEAWLSMLAFRDPDLSRTAAVGAYESDPRNFRAQLALARLAVQAGDDEAAERWYGVAMDADPYGFNLRLEVAEWALESGRTALAGNALDVVEKVIDPDMPEWDEMVQLRRRVQSASR